MLIEVDVMHSEMTLMANIKQNEENLVGVNERIELFKVEILYCVLL